MIPSEITTEDLNRMVQNTLVSHLEIEFTEVGKDFICGRMPVNDKTRQPYGLLHGGASVVLAETLGSVGSNICIAHLKKAAVGQEINANHVRSSKDGFVYGRAELIHFGRRSHIWTIRIENEKKELVCISRLTNAILDKE